jgi:hypothetical protein
VLWCPANIGMLGQGGGTAAPVYVMQRFSWNVFAPAGIDHGHPPQPHPAQIEDRM